MSVKLNILNPSNYPRRGHICVPLEEVSKKMECELEKIRVSDQQGRVLPSQVHITDPANSSDGSVIFSLIDEVPPGRDDYSGSDNSKEFITIDSKATGQEQTSEEIDLEIHHGLDDRPRGVTLRNSRLKVFFNFIPKIDYKEKHWYAGSATSVVLDGEEFLDFANWLCHDREKRCMQLDQVKIPYSAWEPDVCQQIELFNRPYRLVSESCGQVCARFVIASKPFLNNYSDPVTKKKAVILCELYRIISLYTNADYFIENLYIKGMPIKNSTNVDDLIEELFETGKIDKKVTSADPINLSFIGRYFMYMNMSFERRIYRFENVPDWLAIGSLFAPHPGYGFATDVHTNRIENPCEGFPSWSDAHKSFSLELCPCNVAKCLHLFTRREQTLDSRTGKLWYELIYKPLKIQI